MPIAKGPDAGGADIEYRPKRNCDEPELCGVS